MPYTPVLATLGYLISPDGSRVLMVCRDSRPDDVHFGKYNGLRRETRTRGRTSLRAFAGKCERRAAWKV